MTLGAAVGGCQRGAPPWVEDIEGPLPVELLQVGIYGKLATLEPKAGVIEYAPAWPLYADGAEKRRLLRLPEGEANIDAQSWTFPVGTVLAKTFTFQSSEGSETPIETRLLFRRRMGWDYALYQWESDGTNATLLEGNWTEVSVTVQDPAEDRRYVLPSRLDCRICHETSQDHTGAPVLGIGPHQVGPSLQEAGVLTGTQAIEPVIGRSQAETAALGYFVGNCISCHTGGAGPNASFSLYPGDAVEQTVGRPVEGDLGPGIRVVPGAPEASALFAAVVVPEDDGRGRMKAMPPLGVTRPDPAAEQILRRWIEELR